MEFLHCPNTPPLSPAIGGTLGAFVAPNITWSSQAHVQIGKNTFIQTNGKCCRSNLTWPRCWADHMPSGVGTATSRSLHSIHADTRVFHRAGIEKATLENGRLHLKCVGNAQGYYSDTIHTEFEWKLFTSPAIRTNAPMVIVRCINPCKGTFQRFIEYLQQQDWSWTGTRLDFPTFKGRFHRER